MTEPQNTPPTTPEKAGPTRYVVLRETPNGDWARVNVVTAASSGQAIRAVVAKLAEADQAGTFVAPSERSFKPVKVSAKVTTALVLEDVTP